MNQQTLAFFPTFAKKKNNDNIKKSKLMKHLFFLVGLLCLTAAPISSFAQAQNEIGRAHV